MALFKTRDTDDTPADAGTTKLLSFASESAGAIKRALNDSGWFADDIVAAGQLRQGKAPTMAAMVTGTALVELARPRRSKSLPRHFVLAVTADRVIALKAVGGGTQETGPYILRVHAGECGSWPRAAVQMLDLDDGQHSSGGTLQLEGTERLPVSRPNLNGDPDTDELLHVLSGGALSTRQLSPREQGFRDDEDELRRAAAVSPGDDDRRLREDARRGRPAGDLSDWAGRRGLDHRGCAPQAGHLAITCPWSEDVLFNVVRGELPGGAYGVLCHEVRIYDIDTRGVFRGGEILGSGDSVGTFMLDMINPLPTGSGDGGFFKVPYTSAGTRVPHVGSISGLRIARRGERPMLSSPFLETWRERPLDDLGVRDHWVASVRKHSDEAVVERLLAGPIRELLSRQQGLGFEIRIEYGQVIVSRQDFLERDEDLDGLVKTAEDLGRAVAATCAPATAQPALGTTAIEPPQWLAAVRAKPKDKHTLWPIGALLERVVQAADDFDMAVEDPRAFHRTFPSLSVPGEAFGVLRGRLPGTELHGRLLCGAEREMVIPQELRKLLKDPGGAAGSDVAVLGVGPDATPTGPGGDIDQGLRVVVRDGVLVASRIRPSWQADRQALEQLSADVAVVVSRRGLAVV